MKLIKTAFSIALFNFMVVGSVVLALKKPETTTITTALLMSAGIPTEILTPSTPMPSQRPKIAKLATIDPFAAILSQPLPTTQAMVQQGGQTVNPTTPPSQPQPTVDNRCIITIDGARYDVTVFRSIHSGGNVFQCGSDMSAVFHGQHPDSYLQRMAQYRI